jgi:hypothetical protein
MRLSLAEQNFVFMEMGQSITKIAHYFSHLGISFKAFFSLLLS